MCAVMLSTSKLFLNDTIIYKDFFFVGSGSVVICKDSHNVSMQSYDCLPCPLTIHEIVL